MQENPTMNAPFNLDHDTEAASDGLPIPRATLETLEQQRNRALAALLAGFDSMAEGFDAARAAAVSFHHTEGGTLGDYNNPAKLSDEAQRALAEGNQKRETYGREDRRTWREVFADETRQRIDRAVWSHIIEATDLERLMDRQARDEFRASLADDPPAPTAENVRATLLAFMGDADMIFKRGIANAFAKLDRRFRSHDGFKIGSRVILDGYFGTFGVESRGEETLRDIERVFRVLDDREQVAAYAGITGQLRQQCGYGTPRPVLIESDWVRIRVFKNGNAHLWFEREDLVRKVNRLLADYYGETIGEGSDVADVSTMGPGYHLTPARNLGYFATSDETARRLVERIGGHAFQGARVLEPSAGCGVLARKARDLGADVHCVELDAGRAHTLRLDRFAIREGDFLRMQPSDFPGGLFDGVIMNPPFDRGRDCDHVRHALQFVKPGGFLIAIMAARTEFAEDKRTASFRALVEQNKPASSWRRNYFEDLPEGSFSHAGTNVNTVTLALYKA
jgi:predicted RNA methylase